MQTGQEVTFTSVDYANHWNPSPSCLFFRNSTSSSRSTHSSQMKLFIINEVLSDYTSGMVVIAAESKEQCREFFIKEFTEYHADEFDKYAEFTIIEGVNHPAGVVDYVYGGS